MKVLKYTLYLVLLLVALGAVGAGVTAWQSGYRAYAVQTGSMTPTYPTGSLVIDAPVTRPVAVGDVITFRTPDGLVTHRVHDVLAQGIRTKGDGNRTMDAWTLDPDQVVGIVSWGAAYLGYVFVFFQQPTGAPSLMLLLLSVCFAWSLFFPSREPLTAAGQAAERQEETEQDRSLVVLPAGGSDDDDATSADGTTPEVVLPDHSSRSGLLSA